MHRSRRLLRETVTYTPTDRLEASRPVAVLATRLHNWLDLQGPYTYLSVTRPGGRPRMVYVPAGLASMVVGRVAAAVRVDEALAEISAINAELLARREVVW